jgi:hypothetical protein
MRGRGGEIMGEEIKINGLFLFHFFGPRVRAWFDKA